MGLAEDLAARKAAKQAPPPPAKTTLDEVDKAIDVALAPIVDDFTKVVTEALALFDKETASDDFLERLLVAMGDTDLPTGDGVLEAKVAAAVNRGVANAIAAVVANATK